MLRKSESKRISFSCLSFIITLALFITMSLPSLSHAGGGIDGDSFQDYLNDPAVGLNVVGYLFAEYLDPQTSINIFVRRCECLKRLDYTDAGVLFTYPRTLSQTEFDALTPPVLVGMVDPDGQLSTALANGQELIAVVERVLEYKKVGTMFAARVSIKFVAEAP